MTAVRCVEVAEDRSLEVVAREIPAAGPGQVELEIALCGICGSDLHFRDVPVLFPAGTVPGHEVAARIAALGPDVEGWSVGDRVAVLPFAQCGKCEDCRAGREQVCARAIAEGVGLGTGRPGGYAERMVADARMLFALPDEVDDRAAALVEPLAVGVHAVHKADVAPDAPVVVIGGGTIGILTALSLLAAGYDDVLLVSRNDARARVAEGLGIAVLAHGEAPPRTPAAVFECAGSPAAAREAIDMVAPLGRVVLVGIAMAPLDLAAAPLVMKEVSLVGALTYRRADFQEAIDLLASGAIPVERVVTGVAPLDAAEAMFGELTTPGNAHVKVLLRP
jgi:(R,R)-butanediol dehydrogenase / meso-butanediol dehydrogenase / diacetyl reductase